ncbi:MAG: response regulator [Thermoplasmatota archaeon]
MTKILLVDDESSILRSTKILLTDMGLDVITTSDPAAVLPLMQREKPDLVLQDVRMPGLNLVSHMERIRADGQVGRTPVLLFSAMIDLPEIQQKVGAAGYVEKPFHLDHMRAVLHETLETAAIASA